MSLPLPVALVCARYGLHGLKPLSVEDAAELFGISRERVREIETRVLAADRRRDETGSQGRQAMQKKPFVVDARVQPDGSILAESTGLEPGAVGQLLEKQTGKRFNLNMARRVDGGVLNSVWIPVKDTPGICKLCGGGCGPGFENGCSSCLARKSVEKIMTGNLGNLGLEFSLPAGAKVHGCAGCAELRQKADRLERELVCLKNGQNADLVQARVVNQRLLACIAKLNTELRIEHEAAVETAKDLKEAEEDLEDYEKDNDRLENERNEARLERDAALLKATPCLDLRDPDTALLEEVKGELELEKAHREHLQEQLAKVQKPKPGIPVSTQILALVGAAIVAFHALAFAGAIGWKLHGFGFGFGEAPGGVADVKTESVSDYCSHHRTTLSREWLQRNGVYLLDHTSMSVPEGTWITIGDDASASVSSGSR